MISDEQDISKALRIKEYECLQSLFEKRIELRQQLTLALLITAGTFLTIGVQPSISGLSVLVYPILAFFIATWWTHNDLKIGQLSYYFHQVEKKYFGNEAGWETSKREIFQTKKSQKERHPLALAPSEHLLLSARGLFITTELLALTVGLLRSRPLLTENLGSAFLFTLLLALSLAATLLTYKSVQHRRDYIKSKHKYSPYTISQK